MLQIQRKAFSTKDSIIASFHHNRYRKPTHIHQLAELVYVIDGEFTVTASDKHEIAKKGDIIIIQPYQPHRFFTDDGKTVHIWMLLFSKSFIADIMQDHSSNRRYESVVFTPSDEIKHLIEARMFDSKEELVNVSGIDFRRLKALLYPIIDEYAIKVPIIQHYNNENSHIISSVLTYMSEHFKEDISLESVAAAIGYSKSHISHSISSMLSINFKTLLNAFRIEYARNLLLTKNMSIYMIALESGFGCERSFNRAFLKVIGFPPKEYKKARQNLK